VSAKDDLLARFGPKVEAVRMPDGAPCYVRRIAGDEGAGLLGLDGESLLYAILLRSACEADGTRIFGDGDMDDLRALGLTYAFVAGQAAMRVNGLMDEEDVSGKSGAAPAGSSPSG